MPCLLGGVLSDGSCRFSVKQEMPSLTGITRIGDLNTTIDGKIDFQVLSTGEGTSNLPTALPWMYLIQMKGEGTISQLAFPMYKPNDNRLKFRAQAGLNSTTPITESWKEIPYADEVPLLNDDGTISATSNRTQELLTTHLGDMRGSTVGEIKEEINKVFNSSQGGIMVTTLLFHATDFLAHISSDSYTTINEGTKYTIILSGNHKHQKGYALGEIQELGSMRSFYFRINNGYYEYLGESVTMDAVQKAIDEAFKKRNL